MKHWMRIGAMGIALLGAASASVWAHGPDSHGAPSARHSQSLNELKTKLRLDASQEVAWKSYVEAMQMMPMHGGKSERAALQKMNTPERIDQMQAQHQQMQAEIKKRGDATKEFYALLSSEQKKVFDVETLRMVPGVHGHGMHRQMH